AVGNTLSMCSVLGQGACPIAYLSGDLDAAERYGAMLLEHADRYGPRIWRIWAGCFNGLGMTKCGDIAGGGGAVRGGLEAAGDADSCRVSCFSLASWQYASVPPMRSRRG